MVPIFKIILIGDSHVGKTAIINQYISGSQGKAPGSGNTTGVANFYKNIELQNGKKIKLDIWDTTGQEMYSMLNRNHYAGAHAVIIVYSIESLKTFKSVEGYFQEAKNLVNEGTIFVIAGNKCDIASQRMVPYEDLIFKADDLDIELYFETSALQENSHTIEVLF